MSHAFAIDVDVGEREGGGPIVYGTEGRTEAWTCIRSLVERTSIPRYLTVQSKEFKLRHCADSESTLESSARSETTDDEQSSRGKIASSRTFRCPIDIARNPPFQRTEHMLYCI